MNMNSPATSRRNFLKTASQAGLYLAAAPAIITPSRTALCIEPGHYDVMRTFEREDRDGVRHTVTENGCTLTDNVNGKLYNSISLPDQHPAHFVAKYLRGIEVSPHSDHSKDGKPITSAGKSVRPSIDPDEVIPGIPTNVYGDVFSLIDGSPMTGWAKRYDEVVELKDGHYEFEESDLDELQFTESTLFVETPDGMMNVNHPAIAPGRSPMRYDVGSTDPDCPFYHNPGHTNEMLQACPIRWAELPVKIYFSPEDANSEQLSVLEAAVQEWNDAFAPYAERINQYYEDHGIDRPRAPQQLFERIDYKPDSARATTANDKDHWAISIHWDTGTTDTGLWYKPYMDSDQIFWAIVNLTSTGLSTIEHELGHALGAYHVFHSKSVMNSSTGSIRDNDLRCFSIYYGTPFGSRIEWSTLDDVNVKPSTAVNGGNYFMF